MTGNINLFFQIQLIHAVPQTVQRNVNKARNHPSCHLLVRPHIQTDCLLWNLIQIFHIERLHKPFHHISNHIACHVHRIFCRGERRRISQLHFLKVIPSQSKTHCVGQIVNSLVHTFSAYDLCAQNNAAFRVKQSFDGHHLSSRIIASLGRRSGDHLLKRPFAGQKALLLLAGNCNRHIKELHNRRTLASLVGNLFAAQVISHNPALFIGRGCQRNENLLLADHMKNGHCISQGIHIFCGSFHILVYQNLPSLPQFNAAVF